MEKFTSKKVPIAYLKIFISAVLYTFSIQSFLNIGGTFSTGLGALGQLMTYLIKGLTNYFSIIYIVLNIPLIIFFWKKVKKSFIYRTVFFLIIQASVGSIYLIPSAHSALTNLMNIQDGVNDVVSTRTNEWAIIIYALIGSVFAGFAQVIAWKSGGSTAGSDFIGYYYSTKKKHSIGKVLFKISSIIAVLSVIMTLIIDPKGMAARDNWLILCIATALYICITAIMIHILYPKYSKVRLSIHSFKWEEIVKDFKEKGYDHAYNIHEFKSGFVDQKRTSITTVVLFLEVKQIIKRINEIDPNVWISETSVRRVFGAFSTSAIDK